MKTTGELLKNAREKNDLTLKEISKYTRINESFLQAIENNDFNSLPPAAFTKGFMRQYAKAVGLKPEHVLAVFRRDYDQDAHGRVIPRGMINPVKTPSKLFNPTTTAIAIATAISFVVIAFFARQIFQYLSAPPLAISEPQSGSQVVSPFLLTGTTEPQASLTVNGRSTLVQEDGHFETELSLTPGEHLIIIEATSRSEKTTTLQHPLTVAGDSNNP